MRIVMNSKNEGFLYSQRGVLKSIVQWKTKSKDYHHSLLEKCEWNNKIIFFYMISPKSNQPTFIHQ